MNETDPRNDEQGQAPPRLVEALRRLHRARLFIPPEVDRAVSSKARRHFQRLNQRPGRSHLWRGWAAWAASLLLGVWLVQTWMGRKAPAPSVSRGMAGDVDANGTVDILDAFALARLMERDPARARPWDVNGDGRIDRSDVDYLARLAVSLDGGVL